MAGLKRAGVSAGAWRGRACMCGPSPSLVLPRRTLLPRHSHTDAHDCVHTSPCTLWRADTWHAGTRAPAAPTLSLAARRRRAVAASAPPQHALQRRLGASWCSRPGEQACGQRRGHSDKSGLGRRRRSPAPSVSATAAGLWHRSSRCTSKKFFWGLAQQLPAEPSLFSRCPSHARISMCVTVWPASSFFSSGGSRGETTVVKLCSPNMEWIPAFFNLYDKS